MTTTQDTLERAMRLHRAGRLLEAARLYIEVLQVQPAQPDALQLLGLVAWRQGRGAEALLLLDRAVQADPAHTPAWANRALVQQGLGRLADAAESLRRAVAVTPDFADGWRSLSRVALGLGRTEEALAAARRAVALRSDQPGPLAALGAAELAAGRPREAEAALRGALALDSRDAALWVDLSVALRLRGAPDEAARACRQALALDGLMGLAYANLGLALQEQGDPVEAAKALDRAVDLEPEAWDVWLALGHALHAVGSDPEPAWRRAREGGLAAAAYALGALLVQRGRTDEGLALLRAAHREAPSHRVRVALVDAISQHDAPLDDLTDDLLALLAADQLDHGRLVRAGLRALHPVAEAIEAGDDSAADTPLLRAMLQRSIIQDPHWEGILADLASRFIARAAAGDDAPVALLEALAVQAFWTEHAWDVAADLDAVRAAAAASLGQLPLDDAGAARVAAFAITAPLADLDADALAAPGWEARPLAALVRCALVEAAAEAALAPGIPALTPIADVTSAAVAAQYEAHPYPRLVGVHRRAPQPLAAAVRGLVPTLPPDTDLPSPAGKLRVLVAGCGTGQHALTTATRLADADVLAVDLSRASLARAQRRAAEWALPNLRFAAADLLALGDLDQRFDLIESVGVLHHLDDPLRGWRALAGLLSPGGLMQVGLYSERGRSEVVAARALIAAEGLTADDAGLRAARRLFRALPPDHPAWPVVRSPDFYSLSGLRDLLFHACEHRTSPLGVAAMLDALGLRLLGLQHPRAEIAALYAHRFPDDPAQADLARWEALEIDHPRIFSGMMVLWCQTPTSPDNAESAPTTEGAPVSGAGQ